MLMCWELPSEDNPMTSVLIRTIASIAGQVLRTVDRPRRTGSLRLMRAAAAEARQPAYGHAPPPVQGVEGFTLAFPDLGVRPEECAVRPLEWMPWQGPRSDVLQVCARAKDPAGPGWVYAAKKVDGIADAALNLIVKDYSQADHVIFLKRYGRHTSLARWAGLWGIQWVGTCGDRRWRGYLRYPDVSGLNARLERWRLTDGYTFMATESEIDHLEYARLITTRKVVIASQGKYHFHDMFSHVLGYLMYPPDVVENIAQQFSFLLRVYDYGSLHDHMAKQLAEEHIIQLMKIIDRHSTFSPTLVLPKDDGFFEHVRAVLIHLIEQNLLAMSTFCASVRLLRLAVTVCAALAAAQLVGRAYCLDPTFHWLEHRDFDLGAYLQFAEVVVRDIRVLAADVLEAARTRKSIGFQALAQEVAQGLAAASDPIKAVGPTLGAAQGSAQALARALTLRGRMRQRVKDVMHRQRAAGYH
jgi:hypothetical protein